MSDVRSDTKFLCIFLRARPLVQSQMGGCASFEFFYKERSICPQQEQLKSDQSDTNC